MEKTIILKLLNLFKFVFFFETNAHRKNVIKIIVIKNILINIKGDLWNQKFEKFTIHVCFCLSLFISFHPPRHWSYHFNISRHVIANFFWLWIGYNRLQGLIFYVSLKDSSCTKYEFIAKRDAEHILFHYPAVKIKWPIPGQYPPILQYSLYHIFY